MPTDIAINIKMEQISPGTMMTANMIELFLMPNVQTISALALKK